MAENKKDKLKTEIFLTGIIDDNTANKFIEETQDIIDNFIAYKMETSYIKDSMQQNFPTITVTINSPGGDIYAGNLIIARIQEMDELGISLIANGITCMSMAFIIFISFNRRTGDKLFAGMNHSSRSHYMGYREEVRSDLDHSDYMDSLYDDIIRKQTKIPEEQIEESRLKCRYYGYEEAKELGIINYYEGCELEEEDTQRKMVEALQSSIEVFSQLLEIDEEEGINLMCDLLFTAMEMGLFDEETETETETETDEKDCEEVEEEDVDVEIEDDEEELDKNKLAKTLSEILNEAMDEDEEE